MHVLFQKNWSAEEKEDRWKQHRAAALKAAKRSKRKEKHSILTRCQKKNKKSKKKKKQNKKKLINQYWQLTMRVMNFNIHVCLK